MAESILNSLTKSTNLFASFITTNDNAPSVSERLKKLIGYSHVPKEPAKQLLYRQKILEMAEENPDLQQELWILSRRDILFFINTFLYVYEPRQPAILPFNTWEFQDRAILLMDQFLGKRDIGLEKSRDMGATWIFLTVFFHQWLFYPRRAFGLVSRTEDAVDAKDDPDTLMWKLDFHLEHLPKWMRPSVDRIRCSLKNNSNQSIISGYAATQDVARGGRKAQPVDAKILTPSGWRLMGEIKDGDQVIGANGLPTTVVGVYPQGVKKVYRVTFNDGSQTECCDEHYWSVTRAWQRQSRKHYDYSPVQLKDMIDNVRTERKDQTEYNFQVPVTKPVEFFHKSQLPLNPYVVGCLLGDGKLACRNSSPIISSADSELLEKFSSLLPNGCLLVKSSGVDYRIVTKNGSGGAGPNPVSEAMRKLGIAETHSDTKFVPEPYKYASIEERTELLRGLLDTDGWISKRGKSASSCRIKFCSVSPQLIEDVRFVVQSLGGVATTTQRVSRYSHNGEVRSGKTAYELTICLPNGINPFWLPRKASRYVDRTKYLPRRSVISIEPSGTKECQCIKVSADDGLYLTDECIVTHNTAFAMDELASFRTDDGFAAWASTQHVSDCRIAVSTPKGKAGIFAEQMCNKTVAMVKMSIHWSQHPWKRRGLYKSSNGQLEIIDEDYQFPPDYEFSLDGKLRSPWYDMECRRHPIPALIAQELDIDYAGSGFPFFDATMVSNHMTQYACDPFHRGELDYVKENHEPLWMPNPKGRMLLWLNLTVDEEPPHGRDYVVGCDIATGKGGDQSTNSVATVVDRLTGEKVAELVIGDENPEDFADTVMALRKWFHGPAGIAFLIWEDNGPGGQFSKRMAQIPGGFSRIYYRENEKKVTGKRSQYPGFYSNRENKRTLLGDYSRALREGQFVNRSRPALEEMLHYRHMPTGSIEHDRSQATLDPTAAKENHGDRVIADALAWRAIGSATGVAKLDDSKKRAPYGSMAWRWEQLELAQAQASEEKWL